jgi:uncharacterized protein (DUF302 family)
MTDTTKKTNKHWLYLGFGLLLGGVAVAGAVVMLMPSQMIVTHRSTLGFDETLAAIEAAIPEQGWASPGTLDLTAAMNKKGVDFSPRVAVISLCKPEYAKQVLESNRDISALMPCKIAIWEDDAGAVFISKMNTGMMAKLFGGTVAEVMGGSVAREEAAILSGVIQHNEAM